jgi:hypothetical protein
MSPGRGTPAPVFDDDDQASPGRPMPTLVSLHFMRMALRRRRLACVLSAVLGLVAAGTFMLAFPLPHEAKASLVLTHDPDVDSTRAMATNVSLLQTRTVATRTTERLGLTVKPDAFLKSVTVETQGSELMILTLSAPTDAEAVRQLDGLTSTYLEFRAEQLSSQSRILMGGMQQRIKELQVDVADISRRIEQLTADTTASPSTLSDMISQRAYLVDRIEALQQSVEDATLRNSAVVSSSRVLDPPAAEPGLAKRTVVLGLASGLIGGAALGCGTVLFFAITSDRLRRRSDVAGALGLAVPVSVGRIAAIPKGLRWLPPLGAVNHRRVSDRQRLAQAIEDELLTHPSAPLAVAGLDNTDELGLAVAAAARGLAARDYSTTIIDLTNRGSRGLMNVPWAIGSSNAPTLLRPRGLPPLARGAADLLTVGQWHDDDSTPQPQLGDVTLVLAELDPAVGADHLTAWADRVILVVTAGRSSVEKVRTVGEIVRSAGLDLRFAALLRTERMDESSGLGPIEDPAPLQLRENDDRAEPTGKSEAR